jgi:hypothetical protein
VNLDIAFIGAVGFIWYAWQKEADLCITNFYEINKYIDKFRDWSGIEDPKIKDI